MRILIDECLPKQLKGWLGTFQAVTVQEQGWANLKNGKLLRAANDTGFDVFITADKDWVKIHNQRLAPRARRADASSRASCAADREPMILANGTKAA